MTADVAVPLWLALIGAALATVGLLALLSALGVWLLRDSIDDPETDEVIDLRDQVMVNIEGRLRAYGREEQS